MADAPVKGKGLDLGFVKQKVGPLPLGVWLAAALAIYVYLQRKNKSSAAGQQTDPAGNTGTINPRTGYVYGSPEDKAALASNSGTTTDPGTSGATVAGKYEDNNAWARAAINYLVSIGVDPTQANEAIQQYLASQQLTTQQQADVNLTIQSIGPPPNLPGPTGSAPGPVANPPGGNKPPVPVTQPPGGGGGKPPPKTTYASNPPRGFTVSHKTRNTVTLKWNRVAGATGYTVSYSEQRERADIDKKVTTPGTKTSITVGGLEPNSVYYFTVQADPAKRGAPHAGPILGHTTR